MELNIAYACNDAYIEHTGISMISLFENNKDFDEICIFFIDMNISESSKEILVEIVNKYHRKIKFIPFSQLCADLNISSIGRHLESIYAKIFFSRLDGIDKILYLDSDTIIAASLEKLWSLDMSNNLIAGVETLSSIKRNQLVGMTTSDRFINDGVVLINLLQWRKEGVEQKFLNFIEMHNGNPPVLSEGTINAICKGRVIILDPRYNLLSGIIYYSSKEIQRISGLAYYSQEQLDRAKESPAIIHYLAAFYNRPWCIECRHPLKSYYYKYKTLSPWKNIELINKPLPVRLKVIDLIYRIVPFELFLVLKKYLGNG